MASTNLRDRAFNPTSPPPRRPGRHNLQRILLTLFVALFGAGTLLMLGTAGAFAYFSRDLPSPQTINERYQFNSTRIFDRNGVLLHEVYDPNKGKRQTLELAEVPDHVRKSFLSAEDARFYENSGIDLQGIIRAAFTNVTSRGERIAGGSTITQQLVKMTLLTDERALSRKIREAILAIQISRTYSKDQILEMYLNASYFGSQAYGLEAASQTYFAKPTVELTQAEAALIAGLVRSPSSTNPFKDQEAAKAEQKRVLDQMVKHNALTEAQAAQVAAEPLTYNTKQFAELKAPHFAIWVREQLESNPKYGKAGIYQRGLDVTTTLDFRMQEMAELIVRDQVAKLGQFRATDGSLVAINPATGEILAMVGSADYNNKAIKGEVNVALAQRQPGSSIKPITYLAAFQKDWTPGTIVDDVATTFPGTPPYQPKNYDGTFRGKVTVRQALAMSLNIPAVKALQHVGVPAMIDLSKKMGITSFTDPSKYGLAVTLGGGEVRLLDLVGAYAVFANQGKFVSPVSILKVTDQQGNVLEQYNGPRPTTVVDAGRAYMVTGVLLDNDARAPAFGPNSPLKLSRPAAVKTGTTDDYKDNWTVGYTGQLVTGVWVGNADNQAMRGTTGLTGAAPIWHDFMEYALKPLPVDAMGPPAGLTKIAVGRDSGKLWQEGCPEPKVEDFVLPGQSPRERCEKPTPPPPTPTLNPLSSSDGGTREPRATGTPLPSVDELRARAAATATASYSYAATAVAERADRARASAELAGTQVRPTQVLQAVQRTPIPSRTPSPAPTPRT